VSERQAGDGPDAFDRDDELRALLRGGDPAHALRPADPAALAHLLEDIMSADLEVRPRSHEGHDAPHTDYGDRATGPRRRTGVTWLVAAAAAAVIAGAGGFAITGLTGGGSTPQASSEQTADTGESGSAGGTAGLAGETTTLGVAELQGRCAAPTPEILSQYPLAFAGTVTALEGETVTLETTEVYQGDVGETVQVTAEPALFGTLIDRVHFEEGGSYLVAAFDGQVSMCYSGPATGQLLSSFEKGFVH